MWLEGRTTCNGMIGFIGNILQDIGPGTAEHRHCFTMDNLQFHHNRQMAAIIHEAGHKLIMGPLLFNRWAYWVCFQHSSKYANNNN